MRQGKNVFEEFFAGVGQVWSEFALVGFEVHVAADDPSSVLAAYASDANNRDGSPYTNRYLASATVIDGKITRYSEFFDPAPFANSMSIAQTAQR